MRRLVLALSLAVALAACAQPPAPPTPPPAPDAAALRYDVAVGSTQLGNVDGLVVTGPDIALLEVASGAGGGVTLVPGKAGTVTLAFTTHWAAAERTLEDWHFSVITPGANPQQIRRDVMLTISGVDAAPQASYVFARCLPNTHELALGAQDTRVTQAWRIRCEGMRRN